MDESQNRELTKRSACFWRAFRLPLIDQSWLDLLLNPFASLLPGLMAQERARLPVNIWGRIVGWFTLSMQT